MKAAVEHNPMINFASEGSDQKKKKNRIPYSDNKSQVGSVESENSFFHGPTREGDHDPAETQSYVWSWSDFNSLNEISDEKPCLEHSKEFRNFQILQKIGEGTYALVYLCDYPEKTHTDYAAIKCSRSPEIGKDDDEDYNNAMGSYYGCAPGLVTYELAVYLQLWNSKISVPSIPLLYDFGELEDQHTYIAMQLLGPSWEKIIEDEIADSSVIFPYLNQLLDCLEKVHENDLVHCDVKPKNILAKDLASMSEPYLIDFGLAFHMNTSQYGKCNDFVGTPDYSSDDRLLSNRNPLPIDDIISLGYCALHAWLGDLPWRCQDYFSMHYSSLVQFINERKYKMKQGLHHWVPFFKEWFDYCDLVLESEEAVSYERLREIVKKNESALTDEKRSKAMKDLWHESKRKRKRSRDSSN